MPFSAPETERRYDQDRRWCSDRRAHDRRRGWQFDRRQRQIPVETDRRSGDDRRLGADRRSGTERRAPGDRRTYVVISCATTVETGGACGRKAVLKSSATGVWHCLEHLAAAARGH